MDPKELKRPATAIMHTPSVHVKSADPQTARSHSLLTQTVSGQQQLLVLFNPTVVRATLE